MILVILFILRVTVVMQILLSCMRQSSGLRRYGICLLIVLVLIRLLCSRVSV